MIIYDISAIVYEKSGPTHSHVCEIEQKIELLGTKVSRTLRFVRRVLRFIGRLSDLNLPDVIMTKNSGFAQ